MAFWLVKTEPSTYSIDDLSRDKVTDWTGVRNYQARNFLTAMKVGDTVLIYHSNAEPPAVVGIAKVKHAAKPDLTQFDPKSDYFDPASTPEKPRWFCPDLAFVRKLRTPVALGELREHKALEKLPLLQRGARLSVMPIEERQFEIIVGLSGK